MRAHLAHPTDISGFRAEARQLLAHQVPPDHVEWSSGEATLTEEMPGNAATRGMPRAAAAIVPPSFQRLSELVAMHHDPDRYALLYRLLWRLVHEPALRHAPNDPELTRAQHMAHAVRRDIHKMKTQLRFHPLYDHDGRELVQVAFGEPAHYVCEPVAVWFATNMHAAHWVIFTPHRCAEWDRHVLRFGPGLSASARPSPQAPDAEWIAAWRGVLHPTVQ